MSARRPAIPAVLAGVVLSATLAAGSASAAPSTDRSTLHSYARDTWTSIAAMVSPATGLPADNIGGGLRHAGRAGYTSPTNIATYLWSVVSARGIGLISRTDARHRATRVLTALGRMKTHRPSGMFYNWYDPDTGDVLTTWPTDGSAVRPFLSSVDNGWLASALMVTRSAFPALYGEANAILSRMDFRWYYDPNGRSPGFPTGFIRGGFWETEPDGCSVKGNYTGSDDPDVYYNCVHYGGLNNDPRIAYYVAIAMHQLPPKVYFGLFRTFPNDSCTDWGWTEQKAVGYTRHYLGVPTFEGAYRYRGLQFVPTYGGSMFEALMANLVVPEEKWGPRSWGRTHPAYVEGQIEHGLDEAKYGYWGFSPADNPFGGYSVYGVDAMGEDAAGWTSDRQGTLVDHGWGDCRPAKPDPTSWGDGVVTPHASFLALRYAPRAALANLHRIKTELHAYGPGGFYDSVAVRSDTIARRYLMLDQGMVMTALGNALAHDTVRRHFAADGVGQVLHPLLAMETFNVPPHQRTPH